MSLLRGAIIVARHCVSRDRAHQRFSRLASTYGTINGADNDGNDVASEAPIRKSVFISQSTDIFSNLALEDWLYRNYDFSNHHVLLVWRNDPCVVIGRQRNPWKECNVQTAERKGALLARRSEDCDTTYHDNGSLSLSFFTPRDRHNRVYNLHIVARALFREWRLRSVIDEREDIIVEENYKISGAAAKVGRPNAYHHCTLSVDVNKNNLGLSLGRKEKDTITNAMASQVTNLVDINSNIGVDKLISAVGKEYLRTNPNVLVDEGYKFYQQQAGFQFINPTEGWFPGIDKLNSKLRSWDWNFGKTPKFTVNRMLEVASGNGKVHHLNLHLEVQEGIVEEVRMHLPNELASANFDQDASAITDLCGTRYQRQITDSIIAATDYETDALNTSHIEDKNNIMATQ